MILILYNSIIILLLSWAVLVCQLGCVHTGEFTTGLKFVL